MTQVVLGMVKVPYLELIMNKMNHYKSTLIQDLHQLAIGYIWLRPRLALIHKSNHFVTCQVTGHCTFSQYFTAAACIFTSVLNKPEFDIFLSNWCIGLNTSQLHQTLDRLSENQKVEITVFSKKNPLKQIYQNFLLRPIAKLSSSWPVPVKSNLNWDLHYIS